MLIFLGWLIPLFGVAAPPTPANATSALHPDALDPWLALDRSIGAQAYEAYVAAHQNEMPAGSYAVLYSVTGRQGPHTLLVGPFKGIAESRQARDRVYRRLAEARPRDVALRDAIVEVLDPAQVARIRKDGVAELARQLGRDQGDRLHWQERYAALADSNPVSALPLPPSRAQMHVLLEIARAQVQGDALRTLPGITLASTYAQSLDEYAGQRWISMAAKLTTRAGFDPQSAPSQGLTLTAATALGAALVESLAQTPWYADETFAKDAVARLLHRGSESPVAVHPGDYPFLLRRVGRAYLATAAHAMGIAHEPLMLNTPSVSALRLLGSRLSAYAQERDLADRILKLLAGVPVVIDRDDIAGVAVDMLMERRQARASNVHGAKRELDLQDGRQALLAYSARTPTRPLPQDQLDRLLEKGGKAHEVQHLAFVAEGLLGRDPTIRAFGSEAPSLMPGQGPWTVDALQRVVAHIGQADRVRRTLGDDEQDRLQNQTLERAMQFGAAPDNRAELAQQLGQLAGVRDPAPAHTIGETLLQQTGTRPGDKVTPNQAQEAVEKAAKAGGKSAKGPPGSGGRGGGDSGGGPIPLQSLPVLELFARLAATYFGVSSYVDQVAMLAYVLAPDLCKELSEKLSELEAGFGSELGSTAADANRLIRMAGPLMNQIGALAEQAIEKGIEEGSRELVELAVKRFEDQAVDALRKKLAERLGVDPKYIDLVSSLGLPDGNSAAQLATYAREAAQEAARRAVEQSLYKVLSDAGLPANMQESIAHGNWDALAGHVTEAARHKAIQELVGATGLDISDARHVMNGEWSTVGERLQQRAIDHAYAEAARQTGLDEQLLRNPVAQSKRMVETVERLGAMGVIAGAHPDLAKLNELSEQSPQVIIDLQRRRLSADVLDRMTNLSAQNRAFVEQWLSGEPEQALANLREQAEAEARRALLDEGSGALLKLAKRPWTAEAITEASRTLNRQIPTIAVRGVSSQTNAAIQDAGRHLVADLWRFLRDERGWLPSLCQLASANALDWEIMRCLENAPRVKPVLASAQDLVADISNGDEQALGLLLIRALFEVQEGLLEQGRVLRPYINKAQDDPAAALSAAIAGHVDQRMNTARALVASPMLDDMLSLIASQNYAKAARQLADARYSAIAAGASQSLTGTPLLDNWLEERTELAMILRQAHSSQLNLEQAVRDWLVTQATKLAINALEGDPVAAPLGRAAQCALEQPDTAAQCFSRSLAELRASAVEHGLPHAGRDLRQSLADADLNATAAAMQTQLRYDALVATGISPTQAPPLACAPNQDAGCVYRETVLVPALLWLQPGLGESTARKLLATNAPELDLLRQMVQEVPGSAPSVTNRNMLELFSARRNVLLDPEVGGAGGEKQIAALLEKLITGDHAQTLAQQITSRNVSPPVAQCVDIVLRAFIPTGRPDLKREIRPRPGHGGQWMLPGPLADVVDHVRLMAPRGIEALLPKLDQQGQGSACYLTDNRTFDSNPLPGSRVSLAFTLRAVGDEPLQLVNVRKTANETVVLDCATGTEIGRGKADTDLVEVERIEDQGKRPIVFRVAGRTPPLSDSISVALAMEGRLTYDPVTQVLDYSLGREKFPAYEGYARLDGGAWTTMFQLGPEPGAPAWRLFFDNAEFSRVVSRQRIGLKPGTAWCDAAS